MRLLPVVFLVLSGLASGAGAQAVDLKGRVLEKAGNGPVPGALVKVAGSSLSARTDSAGRFVLQGELAAVKDGGKARMAAPRFQEGRLRVQSPEPGREARVEIFGVGGESLGTFRQVLEAGWNRLDLEPVGGRDFLGVARITVGTETWIKRILSLSGRWHADAGPAEPARLSAPARLRKGSGNGNGNGAAGQAGQVEVTMAGLVGRTVDYGGEDSDLGDIVLDYPPRRLDVGAPPPYGARVLLDGGRGRAALQAELAAKWQDWPRFTPSEIMFKAARDPEFPDDTGRAAAQSCCNTLWGYDDIQAKEVHGDAQIHVEWIGMGQYDEAENPDAGPAEAGQPGYVNSGVYVQSRYEVQIESRGNSDALHDMASLVDDYAPMTWAPDRGNGKWQAYDITFRAARYDSSGALTGHARISVWWNGTLVHPNREARAPATGLANHSGEELGPARYGLKLQSEGRDVRFRNVWLKHLDIREPQTNFGY
jgi:hypothetical protein